MSTETLKEPTQQGAVTPLEPHLVSALTRTVSLTDLFATRARQLAPTLDAYDTTDWVRWRALRTAAPVDTTTLSGDRQHYYAPEPLLKGKVFTAPDNGFWRSFADQGMIERVR